MGVILGRERDLNRFRVGLERDCSGCRVVLEWLGRGVGEGESGFRVNSEWVESGFRVDSEWI